MVSGRNKRKLDQFVGSLQERHQEKNTLIRAVDFSQIDPRDADIIIHATPLGMTGKPAELPLPDTFLQKYHAVFDIVYTPARTPLLLHAAACGAKTVPGYLMLLYQATLQFEFFTAQEAPESLMESELLKALRARSY